MKGLVVEPAIYVPNDDKVVLRLISATDLVIKLRRHSRVTYVKVSTYVKVMLYLLVVCFMCA